MAGRLSGRGLEKGRGSERQKDAKGIEEPLVGSCFSLSDLLLYVSLWFCCLFFGSLLKVRGAEYVLPAFKVHVVGGVLSSGGQALTFLLKHIHPSSAGVTSDLRSYLPGQSVKLQDWGSALASGGEAEAQKKEVNLPDARPGDSVLGILL